MVSALDFQAGYRGFESRSGRDNFQTIRTPSSYSMSPGLSIRWIGWCFMIDSGTKCSWVIHENNAMLYKYTTVHSTIAVASMCLGCLVLFVCVELLRPSKPNGGHVEPGHFT